MTDSPPSSSSSKLCALCNNKESRYCCPRCGENYCSLDCYRSEKHSECSESFYRECVTSELATETRDENSRISVIDILNNFNDKYEENFDGLEENFDDLEEALENDRLDSDDDDEVSLEDRLKNVNIDNPEEVWGALTVDERNGFAALMSEGDVGAILPQWEPWWSYSKKVEKVQDLEATDEAEEAALKKCPDFVTVPEFSTLSTVEPAPIIRYNMCNVLSSYAFIVRYFNGEVEPVEGTACVLNICANLEANTNFESPALAMESVAQKCLQSTIIETDDPSLAVMKHDTFVILQGPSKENKSYYCRAALSHLHTIFSDALSNSKSNVEKKQRRGSFSKKFPDHDTEHLPKLHLGKVRRCIKKIEYYLSYVESRGVNN